MFHSLADQFVGRSHHGHCELGHFSLVKVDVDNLWEVNGVLLCWDDLLDVDELDLRDFNWMLVSWDDLLDDHKVNLRKFNRMLVSGDELLHGYVGELRQIYWIFVRFWRLELDLLDLNRLLFHWWWENMNSIHNLFMNDGLHNHWMLDMHGWLLMRHHSSNFRSIHYMRRAPRSGWSIVHHVRR